MPLLEKTTQLSIASAVLTEQQYQANKRTLSDLIQMLESGDKMV
jgi:hypothetical protein